MFYKNGPACKNHYYTSRARPSENLLYDLIINKQLSYPYFNRYLHIHARLEMAFELTTYRLALECGEVHSIFEHHVTITKLIRL